MKKHKDGEYFEAGYYQSTAIYGRLHGISEATVKRRCAAGEIPAKKVGRSWFIKMEDVKV